MNTNFEEQLNRWMRDWNTQTRKNSLKYFVGETGCYGSILKNKKTSYAIT
jgi:hypothetical protein